MYTVICQILTILNQYKKGLLKNVSKNTRGVHYLEIGMLWRKLYLSGTPLKKLALDFDENVQVISRCIWLAKIPQELKDKIKEHPETFTREILVNVFAAKRRHCEKENFKVLRREVQRLLEKGAGTKPLLKKRKKTIIPKISLDPSYNILKSVDLEYRLKQALGFRNQIVFDKNGGGELKFFFQDEKALEALLDMLCGDNVV